MAHLVLWKTPTVEYRALSLHYHTPANTNFVFKELNPLLAHSSNGMCNPCVPHELHMPFEICANNGGIGINRIRSKWTGSWISLLQLIFLELVASNFIFLQQKRCCGIWTPRAGMVNFEAVNHIIWSKISNRYNNCTALYSLEMFCKGMHASQVFLLILKYKLKIMNSSCY